MTVLEYLDEWCASLTKLSPAQREAKFFDLLPFDRGRAFNGLVDRFARAEELRNGYLRDLGDTTRACDSLKRELADTQRSLKVANGVTDEVRIRLHEVQSDAVLQRANANNLGVSLNKLRLQANGWKEENEQLRKERDQLVASVRALQEVKEDRQTDARLFLELVRAGQDADSVRKAITAYNDIRKNGLTPRSG